MLSYQHGYHAGNLADVHKHGLLAWVLAYLRRKDKPLSYLETHAGRGLYDLEDDAARRTGEAAAGIGRAEAAGWFGPDHPYAGVLAATRARFGAAAYPGSPLVAALGLRPGDRITLAELHPQEHAALERHLAPFGATCLRRDGFEMARALVPPTPRRGLMLIDPSYEVKSVYAELPRLVAEVHRKWNVGVLMVWYPVLAGEARHPMPRALDALGLPRALRHEVRFAPARPGHRMQGSGLFVVNAPHGLDVEAARLGALFATLPGAGKGPAQPSRISRAAPRRP